MQSLGPRGSYREKLAPERLAEMRGMVESGSLSYRQIAKALNLSAATISRYARQEGWQRPAELLDPPDLAGSSPPGHRVRGDARGGRRERISERLWRLAERHAEELEDQPIARAGRALQPLARLTRTLGEIDKHVSPPLQSYEYDIDAPKPRRNIHDLRNELAAHLERIEGEERDFEERWGRTFENGGGI